MAKLKNLNIVTSINKSTKTKFKCKQLPHVEHM